MYDIHYLSRMLFMLQLTIKYVYASNVHMIFIKYFLTTIMNVFVLYTP